MSAPTIHTINATTTAGVPPAPPEAHQKAGWTQISEKDLERHCLSGEFFISARALAIVSDSGATLDSTLAWFNGAYESITVGETRRISPELQAFFGYDGSKPNGRCFFVRIDVAH